MPYPRHSSPSILSSRSVDCGKVALVHDWLTVPGGSERVLHLLCEIFPDAPIYTSVYDEKRMGNLFPKDRVVTSSLQKWPFSSRLYTKMLSLMPRAFEAFDLSHYDLVLSSSSACAKGVLTGPDTLHLAYIHTPMRYVWDLYHDYYKASGLLTRFFMKRMSPQLRLWDSVSSLWVDHFFANSLYVARRIEKFYRREATVIPPPVDTHFFSPAEIPRETYYFILSRLAVHKRIDLAIEACCRLGRPLLIAGEGPHRDKLEKEAGPTVRFLGRITDQEALHHYRSCQAFLFPGIEDFGITPLEAQACGCPVIAYGRGGVLETVLDGVTGLFFHTPSPVALASTLEHFEEISLDPAAMRHHAEQFSPEVFMARLKKTISALYESFLASGRRKTRSPSL